MSLLIEDIWFLLITAVLWGAIGWWMRSAGQRKIVASMEQDHQLKMQSLRRARDDYRDQLEELAAGGGALNSNQKAQVTEYVRKLEGKIADGKNQIASLSAKLEQLSTAAQEREAQWQTLQSKLAASAPQTPLSDALDSAAEQVREHKRTIARLNTRIQSLSRKQQEPMAADEHARLLDVIRAQKETIAGMARKAEQRDEKSVSDSDEREAQLERTIAARDKELNRAREQIAQMHERTRAQDETIRELQSSPSHDADHESLVQAMREQEKIIVTLKEQLREQVKGPARAPAAATSSRSGDLFARPPSVLLRAPDGQADDLQKIHGVGPVLETKLNELGIFHYRQVAALSDDDIGWIAAQMNAFPNRILRDRWVSQAAVLAGADTEDD